MISFVIELPRLFEAIADFARSGTVLRGLFRVGTAPVRDPTV
jgi:hypothetical protein